MCLYKLQICFQDLEETLLFEWYDKKLAYSEKFFAKILIKGVYENKDFIDECIRKHSKIEMEKISIINLSILRISVYCFFYESIDYKITISEALFLVNYFENKKSMAFVNAILDSIYQKEILENARQ